jgi:hypothetical protein
VDFTNFLFMIRYIGPQNPKAKAAAGPVDQYLGLSFWSGALLQRPAAGAAPDGSVPPLSEAGPDMDIILHLGAHRTATTTFQRYLMHNAHDLRALGVTCWTPPLTRGERFAGLIENPSKVTPRIDAIAERSACRIRRDLEMLNRGATRQVLISEENLIGTIRGNLREGQLYPDLTERLSRFLCALGGSVARLGIGLRSYDSYWASALAFAIGRGFAGPDGALPGVLADHPRGWRAILTEIAALCPDAEIIVWPFEALASDPDGQLGLLTGGLRLAPGAAGDAGHHNVSPDAATLDAILSGHLGASDAPRQSREGQRWMPFDPAQRATMRGRYLDDLDWLAAGAGHEIRFFGTEQDTVGQRRVTHTRMLDRASEASGFAAPARAWTPLNGGRGIGNERRMV